LLHCEMKNPVSEIDEDVIKYSLLQIARSLDPKEDRIYRTNTVEVNYYKTDIYVEISKRWKLKCSRLKHYLS